MVHPVYLDTQTNLPLLGVPFITSKTEGFPCGGSGWSAVCVNTSSAHRRLCLGTWPGHGGKEETPKLKSFHQQAGDEEFSQWIEPRTKPGAQTLFWLKSQALRGMEKWFEPQRTGEAQLLAEDKTTSRWFPGALAHHQTSHFLRGFMGEPGGQLKCSANSRELETVPMTRKREGLCGSVMSPSCELSGVRTEHHTCKGRARGLSTDTHHHGTSLGLNPTSLPV